VYCVAVDLGIRSVGEYELKRVKFVFGRNETFAKCLRCLNYIGYAIEVG
jgi:hypothetical protein